MEERTLTVPGYFKWIAPFFTSWTAFAVWAFFINSSEPPNLFGGALAVGILGFFAVVSHLLAVRTRVNVTSEGIQVAGLGGTRSARWSEIQYASSEAGFLVLHLASGKPLRANSYLEGYDWLVMVVDQRGLLRDENAAV
jgi:hypothetical protein